MYQGKKVFVLGMARSGYEVAKVLSEAGATVLITDMKDQKEEHVLELKKLGVEYKITSEPVDLLTEEFDYLVRNPGVPLDHKCLIKSQELNIQIVNEMEVAYNLLPSNVKIIGITGSNGKTTTSTITYNILKEAGKPVHLCGNIGIPFSGMLNKIKENDIIVLEISAQQLHDFDNFKADISLITNLSPAHLDFFKTYEYYVEHKFKIFNNLLENDVAIINLENINDIPDIKAKKIIFSGNEKANVYIENKAIYYNGQLITYLNDIRVKGIHNYKNIMCAIIISKEFGVSNDVIKKVLSQFSGVEHRLEYVRKINNREFYNDSKSTNIISTQVALNSFTNPTILLLGGLDRGDSFEELNDYLKNVKIILAFGEVKNKIKDFAISINMDCIVVNNIQEAVTVSYNLSDAGDTILLSPACASWDQYPDFEVRGNDYKRAVERLI